MRRSAVLALTVAATALGAAAPATAAGPQRLVLDARFTSVKAAGPDDQHVGHQQVIGGVLRSAGGRRLGTFDFTCAWIAVTPEIREHCVATARTADGKLHAAGPARAASTSHRWSIVRGTKAFRGASGTVAVRDLNDRESLVTVTATTRSGVKLHRGLAPLRPRNARFDRKARKTCRSAAAQLATLPPFPYTDFEPLHPDPSLLPQVGAFFTGAGDPRPALTSLDQRLAALGRPPVLRSTWSAFLGARDAALANIQAQDTAALAADVPGFVKTVRASSAAFRAVAITGTVFAVPACII